MTRYQFLHHSIFERLRTLRESLPSDDVLVTLSPVQRGYYDAVRDEIIYLQSLLSQLSYYGED